MYCGCNRNKSLINKFTYDICNVLHYFIGNYDNVLIVEVQCMKAQCMNSEIVMICTVYVINLPVIKIQ